MNRTNAQNTKVFRAGLLTLALGLAAFAPAQDLDGKGQSSLTASMGITQKLGDAVPKDAAFKDESGKSIQFGDLFGKRPIVLVPIFYACRTGCPLVIDGVLKTIAKANKAENEMIVGRDFDVVLLGIHPKETPELAAAKKKLILNAVEPPQADASWRTYAEKGWHCLTGDEASIRKITDAVGFKYKYDPVKDLINHPTCTIFLTTDGHVSSYTIGNDFPTTVVKDDLSIAAKNEVGDPADQSMMFGCIMIDPATGKIRVVVQNIMRVAGALTLLIVGGSIISMSVKTKREEQRRELGEAEQADDSTRNHK